jgi:hypothetical protein
MRLRAGRFDCAMIANSVIDFWRLVLAGFDLARDTAISTPDVS